MRFRKLAALMVSLLRFSMVGVLSIGSALAQEGASDPDGWQFSAAVYLWGADIGGRTATGSSVEVGFGDILDNLEGAFMGAFEARRGKWSILTDAIYLDVAANRDVPVGPGPIVTGNVSLDLTGTVFHLAGSYNLFTEGQTRLDLVAGARTLDLDTTLMATIDVLGQSLTRVVSASDNTADLIVGVRGNIALGERWFLPYYFDVGGGDSDRTWQAMAGVGFRAARWVDVVFVYRHLEWSFDSTQLVASQDYSGPTVGGIFRF